MKKRDMTRRGLLGYIMSPYDPFGIVEPAMLTTKLLQREIIPPQKNDPHNYHALGWDDPLPSHFTKQWDEMVKICSEVQELSVPRSFYPANREGQKGSSCTHFQTPQT